MPTWVAGRRWTATLGRTALWAGLTWLFAGHVTRPFVVRGSSMEPTVSDGAVGVGFLLAYRTRPPAPGEIVMIRMAGNRLMYLKRVLAGPGETAQFRGGELWVDGRRREEPYLSRPCDWDSAETRLGAGQFLVAGDRRDMPMSEHTAGVVERNRIAGKLWTWFRVGG